SSIMHRLGFCAGQLGSLRLRLAGQLLPARAMSLKVGDKLPAMELVEGLEMKKVNLQELFAGQRSILFGVPGAFTPTCSRVHLPSYVRDYDKLKAKGISQVFCLAVNDPFVMQAWSDANGAEGKVRMLSDTQAIFVEAAGLSLDLSHLLGGLRAKRFVMVIEDGVVKQLDVEPDPTKATCTLADQLLQSL
ncbi:hypothetical protein BOX15_Mlig033249g2, partial [Macrostomum lignano]